MNKKLPALTIFFLLVFGSLNYGKANNTIHKASHSSATSNKKEYKFGLQASYMFYHIQSGGFAEYKLSKRLGIRSGMLYSVDIIGVYNELQSMEYVRVPILGTIYPGFRRQFCFFGGIDVGYLIKNQAGGGSDSKTINMSKLRRIQVGIVGGVSYEFSLGLILGFSSEHCLIAPESNWNVLSYYPLIFMNLGLDFVQLYYWILDH